MASSAANSSFIATSIRRAIVAANSNSKTSKRNRIFECDYCNERIEVLSGRPLNHPEGSLHRCGRPVNYGRELVI